MTFFVFARPGGIWNGDPDCIEMMQAVDALDPEWRALVHEYGGGIVREMHDDGMDVLMAEVMLEQRRERRQAQLLAEDHITERVAEGFQRAFRRIAPARRAA